MNGSHVNQVLEQARQPDSMASHGRSGPVHTSNCFERMPMAKTAYKRAERVADQIRMEVADILMRKIKDPRVRSVTVTDVELTADLRLARIYVTTMEPAGSRTPNLRRIAEGSRIYSGGTGKTRVSSIFTGTHVCEGPQRSAG